MRQLAMVVLATVLPVAGFAQDAIIRIEAKRGAGVADTVAGWAERFDDVVTFPLPGGWTGIGLGPLDRAAADARIAELKSARAIPADSFVAVPAAGTVLTPVAGQAGDAADAVETTVEAVAEPVVEPEPAPETAHIRLEAFQDRVEADEALARWQADYPGAGLWALPNGWFGIAVGPVLPETAAAWLPVLKQAGAVPQDAFIADVADMGDTLVAGDAADLPAPGASEPMPPLTDVQRALRWAGYYDGVIDGLDGPGTQAAIRAEIAAERESLDPGTAMRLLIERRDDWRAGMELVELRDDATGLSLTAPMQFLEFDRAERALSIYGPRDGSGAALILFSQPGGQQELLDLSGLVTALGWVPSPERMITQGHILLTGANDDHISRAEGWVRDNRAIGYVLIWPSASASEAPRIAAEISETLTRFAPAGNEAATQ
ncbi:peptidoglycan-binding protein [Paracoccus sp. (in: a-proteobacteria)]|uniref:peptidoglycan-binding protein n=1 Tax=Paracoccus sp. TaxID=267 RepID=UPI0026E06EBF|nr:peptidoglycan-binding protein [Paracoccus sp. (in: a-proteobacteria)]MDO5646739.1 peptidoglycan-binding protein [Paracoccus sp. (in: a-proteobacteria)]